MGNENSKPILASPSDIKSGDKFTMDGEVYTVVDKPGIYPDDVHCPDHRFLSAHGGDCTGNLVTDHSANDSQPVYEQV